MTKNKPLYPLINDIKTYNWGHLTMLPELLGYQNIENTPQAELWIGMHSEGMSKVLLGDTLCDLATLIAQDKSYFLGDKALKKFGSHLPFLFKVLAINEPLSLQVHPNKQQAKEGFAHENSLGMAMNDTQRCYKDSNHKTELLCAWSDDVWALCGFRPYADIYAEFKQLNSNELTSLVEKLGNNLTAEGLADFIHSLITLPKVTVPSIMKDVLAYSVPKSAPCFRWLEKLQAMYPNDMATLAPLYMNVVHVPKGKAIFVENGVLHAYLQGMGIEIMTVSDNVIRLGLTPKHIDIASLATIVSFNPTEVKFLDADPTHGGFSTPCGEFLLAHHHITLSHPHVLVAHNPAQIMLCVEGAIEVFSASHADDPLYTLSQGQSFFVPFNAGDYEFKGNGELFIASTPFI
jgi:mannose-6-phosphate isomerase